MIKGTTCLNTSFFCFWHQCSDGKCSGHKLQI